MAIECEEDREFLNSDYGISDEYDRNGYVEVSPPAIEEHYGETYGDGRPESLENCASTVRSGGRAIGIGPGGA